MSFQASRVVAVVKANQDLPNGTASALLVGTAGTAELMDATGATISNVPLQVGYNPIRVKQVRIGGTASDIWALY
jgi:hypothetical protein